MFRKYIGDSKMFEYDKYYRECQQQNKPFIKAKTNPVHGNYYVQVDLMTCSFALSKKGQDEIEKMVQKEMEYVETSMKFEFQGFSIGDDLAWFDGVPSEHVDAFCTCLYDLTQKHRD